MAAGSFPAWIGAAGGAGGGVDRDHRTVVAGDVGGRAVRRDRDGVGVVPDRDRRARGVGGGRDRGHRARAVVGDVDGRAVRRHRQGNWALSDRDRRAGDAGGDRDRGHRAHGEHVVGNVGVNRRCQRVGRGLGRGGTWQRVRGEPAGQGSLFSLRARARAARQLALCRRHPDGGRRTAPGDGHRSPHPRATGRRRRPGR